MKRFETIRRSIYQQKYPADKSNFKHDPEASLSVKVYRTGEKIDIIATAITDSLEWTDALAYTIRHRQTFLLNKIAIVADSENAKALVNICVNNEICLSKLLAGGRAEDTAEHPWHIGSAHDVLTVRIQSEYAQKTFWRIRIEGQENNAVLQIGRPWSFNAFED